MGFMKTYVKFAGILWRCLSLSWTSISCALSIVSVSKTIPIRIIQHFITFRWGKEGARETVRLTVGRDATKQMVDKAVDAFAAALMC